MNKIITKSTHDSSYYSTHKSFIFKLIFIMLLCALISCMTACIPHHQTSRHSPQDTQAREETGGSTALLRADPGYIDWLEKQSFIHATHELIGTVSGTHLAWHRDSMTVNPCPLLQKSSMWLELNPQTIRYTQDNSSICKQLSRPSIVTSLQQKGLALYLSDIQDADSVWTINNTNTANTFSDGEVKNLPLSYNIASKVGTEQDIMELAFYLRQGAQNTTYILRPQLLGTDITPASTALGPDFFLAARGHKSYIGAYVMVEVPQSDWALLPHVQEDWQCQALTPAQQKSLQQKGLIPKKLYRDTKPLYNKNTKNTNKTKSENGWAATGVIRGVDGNIRRWVFAYADSAMHPILHWNDPSKRAQRIFSASIIKNTGMLGMPLVGLTLQDLRGLEVAPSTVLDADTVEGTNFIRMVNENEPMLTAATTLAREIRSYGGWSWLRQALPTALLPYYMQSIDHGSRGPDFFTSYVGDTIKQALEQGQATPLQNYYDALLQYNIDTTRLAHTLPSMNRGAQDVALATTLLATQSGLVLYPAQNILSLTEKLSGNRNPLTAQNTITIQELQKNILALPDYSSWREYYQVATGKLIARLPSSKASLIVASALPNNEKQFLVTITNVTEHNVQERLSLDEAIFQTTPYIQEINAPNMPLANNNILDLQGDTHFIELEIPAKTCRIFIISNS